MKDKTKISNIGALLSEDSEGVEVMFDGYDIRTFLIELANTEFDGENEPKAMQHIQELYALFSNPKRQRYEMRAYVLKNRYAAANEEEQNNFNTKESKQ